MLLKLTKYDLDVHYVPGKQQVISDCLSRAPLIDTEPASDPEYVIGVNLIEELGLESIVLLIILFRYWHISFHRKIGSLN